jgi:hypothetical protein
MSQRYYITDGSDWIAEYPAKRLWSPKGEVRDDECLIMDEEYQLIGKTNIHKLSPAVAEAAISSWNRGVGELHKELAAKG